MFKTFLNVKNKNKINAEGILLQARSGPNQVILLTVSLILLGVFLHD